MLKEREASSIQKVLEALIRYCILAVAFILPFSQDLTTVCLALGACLWIGKMLVTGSFKTKRTPFDAAIILFVLLAGLSIAVSPIPRFSYYNYYHSMGPYIFLYYFFVNNITSEQQVKQVVKVMLVSAVAVTLYGFYQYVFGVDISAFDWVDDGKFPDLKIRVFSTLNNPNLLAGFLVIMMSMAVGLSCTAETAKARFLFLSCLVLFSWCLILTYSRGAWLSILVILVAYGMFYDRKVFWCLPILPCLAFATHHTLIERLTSILDPSDTSSTLRVALWQSTLTMIHDKPLLGIGWGAYWKVYPHYDFFIKDLSIRIFHAHNMYLNIAAEIGIPGLLAFLRILFGHFKTALSLLVSTHSAWIAGIMLGIVFAITGTIVNGFTDYVMFNNKLALLFWLLNALVVAVWHFSAAEESPPPDTTVQ